MEPLDGEGEKGYEPGYTPTPEDLRLQEVYRDWSHANPGTHLDDGIGNDTAWKSWWRDLAVMPSRRYDAPSRKVGRRFVDTLRGELHGVRERQSNLERFIVFQTMILQQAQHVTASQAIRRRIENRLDVWEADRHRMLMEENLCMCAQYLTAAHREESEEHRDQTFHRGAADVGAVDHGKGDGGRTTARGAVHKDGVEGDGGAAHQTPRGPSTNSSQPGLVPRPPTRSCPC